MARTPQRSDEPTTAGRTAKEARPEEPQIDARLATAFAGTPFEDATVVHVYTVEQALQDGNLVNAREGEYADVTSQHHPNPIPVYLTGTLHHTIRRACENPHFANDPLGVWHDILQMSRPAILRLLKAQGGQAPFQVIITGLGRETLRTVYLALSGDGWTYMVVDDL